MARLVAEQNQPPTIITAHPPERRRKKSVILCGCCCCCCCCCCLHTVGGVLGSELTKSYIPVPEEVPLEVTDRERVSGRLAYLIVLLTLTSLSVIGMHLYFLEELSSPLNRWNETIAIEILILLLGFPVLQLVAAGLTLVGISFFAKRELRRLYARSVARIMGGTFVGAGIGLVLTIGAFFLVLAAIK